MLPPFGLWLINLIMSKEFYITSLDNNMNRGTFQGVFAFFFIFYQVGTCAADRGRAQAYFRVSYASLLSGCTNCVFGFLCLTKPSLLAIHGSIAPCRGISVLRSTILQPLSSFAMRSCGSMPVPSPCPRRTSLTLWLNINKKTRCSKLHLCFYSSVLLFCYSSLLCCSALFLLLKPASWLSRGHFSRPAFSAP